MSGATSSMRGAMTMAISATIRNQELATVTSMPATVPSRNVPGACLRRGSARWGDPSGLTPRGYGMRTPGPAFRVLSAAWPSVGS